MNSKELLKRRRMLMRMVGSNGVAVIPSAELVQRSRDVDYSFRQDSDFLYLTGFEEPDALAILLPDQAGGQYILFCRERDAEKEIWNGRRAGLSGARKDYFADKAYAIRKLDEILPKLLSGRERIFYPMGRDASFDRKIIRWVNQSRGSSRTTSHIQQELLSLDYLLHDMRLYKSHNEVSLMRQAAKVSIAAHKRAMRACKPGMHEYEVEAELLYEFKKAGCAAAYPCIVGGGKNSCILHYTENKQVLGDGDMLLIDAGAEYQGYASDITRTFPVNGIFSKAQREAYELVLEAQAAAIKKAIPGNHWNDPHNEAVKVLTKGLVSLGLLQGRPAKLIREGEYRRFFMHRTGHWLGLDVHDVGDYRIGDEWRLLEPGMMLTVEPGLYITKAKDVAKCFWDTGIRIEDDVLVTNEGNKVLTDALTRGPDEIEALMASSVH
ncbi:MAG: aminopeptidase P N-terminal domain-containing protein [Gammaproteobacteria bacterium]|nr:aminopeptidase P N-terminal domain-containing protein [Gammaproteobacteria bacterium]MDE0410591.1 aminopeptidase P N-terminal domain-containing protein [Gammaproteobacteria bacterium]